MTLVLISILFVLMPVIIILIINKQYTQGFIDGQASELLRIKYVDVDYEN